MRFYQGHTMKIITLATLLTLSALQAENVVHYDTKEVKKPAISKPNHPTTDLYTGK